MFNTQMKYRIYKGVTVVKGKKRDAAWVHDGKHASN